MQYQQELDRYLEAEGDSPVDQSTLTESITSNVLEEMKTIPLMKSSSPSYSSSHTSDSSRDKSHPGNDHIHRITDDELQPPHVIEERRRRRVDEILRRASEREKKFDNEVEQFMNRLNTAQQLRKKQFEKLRQAMKIEFQEIDEELKELRSGSYSDDQDLMGSEFLSGVGDRDNDMLDMEAILRSYDAAKSESERDAIISSEAKKWAEKCENELNCEDCHDIAEDDLHSLDQLGAALDSLGFSSPRGMNNACTNNLVAEKSESDKAIDALLGLDTNEKENHSFSGGKADPNLSQSTIDIDLNFSKLDDHIMSFMDNDHLSALMEASNDKLKTEGDVDLSSSQPAKPISSSLFLSQQQSPFSSSISKKENKSVTFKLDDRVVDPVSEFQDVGGNRSANGLESGIFLYPHSVARRHHGRQEQLDDEDDDHSTSIENNQSIIHCNFDMSSRGPGKHKKSRPG